MKKGRESPTRFIATVGEEHKSQLASIARRLEKDGITIENVSTLFGIITGHSCIPLSELQSKYKAENIIFEPDREVGM